MASVPQHCRCRSTVGGCFVAAAARRNSYARDLGNHPHCRSERKITGGPMWRRADPLSKSAARDVAPPANRAALLFSILPSLRRAQTARQTLHGQSRKLLRRKLRGVDRCAEAWRQDRRPQVIGGGLLLEMPLERLKD